ncbi:MAG TPA: hypothetical protein VMU04_24715 [Candidatus Acidoferrum sp.]|nr:hypothetical protein [Candidatus Acidoferrum sp.]
MNDYTVRVTVAGAERGSGDQPSMEYAAASCVCRWSWGLQPATALIEWVTGATPDLQPLAALTIEMIHTASGEVRHTFYGICKQVAPVLGSDGISVMQEFVDSRELLQWDVMYCAFNKRESRLVDDGTGNFVWKRHYWHIYPKDFNSQSKTYTDGPLTAIEIMDALFGSPTCESPWTRVYHPALEQPVYDFDCLSGKKLGACLVELSEALGCQFTLMGGRYNLVWCVRGAGATPTAPPDSDNRRTGSTLSGNPSRIRLLGERDLYQVMNLELEADWLPAWQAFWNLDALAADIFDNEALDTPCAGIDAGTRYNAIPGDEGNLIGRYLAQARSRTITVGAYAALRDARASADGADFRDFRKLGGRSRLQMPAALYIAMVVFRAFRPPRSFMLYNAYRQNLNLWALELVEQGLVEVTHDPVTGQMTWEQDVISASNGYAICQGYQVGQDGYKTLRPEHFQLNQWIAGQNTWQRCTFQVDDSGEGVKFILFDAPVINSADLIKQSADLSDYPVMSATPKFNTPRVRAALIFAGEPYSYIAGVGTKDDVVNVQGLNGHFVVEADGSSVEELPFADGLTANEKALGIAESLLNQQFTYAQGGHTIQGIDGTQLSEVIGGVTVRYGPDGATEEVDYSAERDRNVSPGFGGGLVLHVPPERDFDRRAQLINLLPGQRELREEARQLRLVGASLRQNPKMARTLLEAFAMAFGLDAMPATAYVDPDMLEAKRTGNIQHPTSNIQHPRGETGLAGMKTSSGGIANSQSPIAETEKSGLAGTLALPGEETKRGGNIQHPTSNIQHPRRETGLAGMKTGSGGIANSQSPIAKAAGAPEVQTLRAGTPLFKESGERVVLSPLGAVGEVVASDPVFVGVTVLDGQPVNGPLHVTATGDGGVIYARVKGPVSTNDPVGLPPDTTGVQAYLTGNPKLAVGNVLEPITSTSIGLVQVRVGGAGTTLGGTMQCRIKQLFNGVKNPKGDPNAQPPYPINAPGVIYVIKYNAGNEWGSPFWIAKTDPAQMPAAETIDGITYSYVYTDDNTRTARWTDANGIEWVAQHKMYKRFNVGDVIYVQAADHTDQYQPQLDSTGWPNGKVLDVEIKYREDNTAREWGEVSVSQVS